MATSNFYYVNASKVFAIGLGCETEECEDIIENVKYILEENKGKFSYSENERESQNDSRNFSAHFIGSLSTNKNFGDVDIQINCFYRIGYYDGACLDWELELTVNGDDTEDIESSFENVYSDLNVGMLKIQGNNASKWSKKVIDQLSETVETVFANCSTTMVKVATFSNGETIYKEVK